MKNITNSKGFEIYLSIVIPLFNEEESVDLLLKRIKQVGSAFVFSWEVILVDDGSTDDTWMEIERHRMEMQELRAIKLRSNCGQTGAMVAGFDHSRGKIIVTLDGDLQNDPSDIPFLLSKLEEGYDIVSGWRRERKDHWSRVLPSKIANTLISSITGVHLHDYGCSLKAYRADCIRKLDCYGEMHRFFPALASMTGARVTEIPVQHYARQFGRSKYGFDRIFKVFSDIFAIKMIIRFSTIPLKGFVLCATPFLLLTLGFGGLAVSATVFDWTAGKSMFFSVISALSFFGVLLMLALGFLGELTLALSDLSHTRFITATSRKISINGAEELNSKDDAA